MALDDIARSAGVSRSTISRAFTQPELLRPETVSRIRAIASQMGYTVNHAARGLSTGKFSNVAVVVPDIANPFFPPLVRKVQAAAAEAGYAVFLSDSDESEAREEALISRIRNQVDGLVVASPRMPDQALRRFVGMKPLVLINRDLAGVARVIVDVEGGMLEAIHHLKEFGHRRIAYVAGPKDSWSDQQRRRAVTEMGSRAGLAVSLIELGRPDHAAARGVVSRLHASGATAAIAFDDVVAQGLIAGLAARGLGVPRDLSIIGCDDILAATTQPPLTTISAGSAYAGEAAIRLLLRLLDGEAVDEKDQRIVVDTHLVIRASAGPVGA